jgi:hypothetical protein
MNGTTVHKASSLVEPVMGCGSSTERRRYLTAKITRHPISSEKNGYRDQKEIEMIHLSGHLLAASGKRGKLENIEFKPVYP